MLTTLVTESLHLLQQISLELSNKDTAFGWGDHSTAGYLTAEAAAVTAEMLTGGNIQFGDNQFAVFGWVTCQLDILLVL